jgi:FixJ family two-component response regulator
MKDKHVYVVDDDESARIGLSRLLRTAGYHVHSYASADKFLNAFSSDRAGCIVLDARMPGHSGAELAEILRKHYQNIPIIFVTADEDPETKMKAKKMKAVGFFRKPVDGQALIDAIDWALKSRRKGDSHDEMIDQ